MAVEIAYAILGILGLYVLAGIAAAMAFQLRATHIAFAHFTIGARVLLIPGMVALWPVILRRWIAAR